MFQPVFQTWEMELAMFSGFKSLHESNTHVDEQKVNGTKQKSTPSEVRARAVVSDRYGEEGPSITVLDAEVGGLRGPEFVFSSRIG